MKNDFSYIEKIKEDLKEVKGVIANLYFMSKKEMKEELELEDIDVYEMFKISTNLFKEHFPDKKVIFSIEGCDYIKDTKELENLYRLGLRNLLLVWNNENRYGSGIRSNKGLTKLGKEFITKAVSLGICIDLSHMNENTFWDTIELLRELKETGKHPKVIASHSNSYTLCHHPRNLKDDQIDAIKELKGIVGLVAYGPFIQENNENLEDNYLKHMNYMIERLGIDSVAVATDNMDFITDLFGIDEGISLLNHKDIQNQLTRILNKDYNEEEMEKLRYKNVEEFFKE